MTNFKFQLTNPYLKRYSEQSFEHKIIQASCVLQKTVTSGRPRVAEVQETSTNSEMH